MHRYTREAISLPLWQELHETVCTSLPNGFSHQRLSNNSDLLSRHLKLESDSSGHGEAGNYSGLLLFDNNTTEPTHLESELDGSSNAPLKVRELTHPLPQGGLNNQRDAVASIFPANAVRQIQHSEDINVSGYILLPPDTSHSFLVENLEDLNVLWGSVDTSFSLERLGFGLPNDLISLPGLDISGSTPSGIPGQSIDKTPHSAVLDSPLSDGSRPGTAGRPGR